MKKLLLFITCTLLIGIGLYSCRGNNRTSENERNSSNTKEEFSNSGDNSQSLIDVNAASDSKGIGKFKEVKISKTIDPELVKKGKEVFQMKCFSCHMVTDQKLTVGPGLKGITKIRTPTWIMNMITNPVGMVQKDPIAKALYKKFSHIQMPDLKVNDQEVRALLEFLRQNDKQ